MPASVIGPQSNIPLTVNGSSTGYVTIDPSIVLLPYTKVTIRSGNINVPAAECIVTSSLNGVVYLRKLPVDQYDKANLYNYGNSDMSAYLVADSSYLVVNTQVIQTDHLYRAMPPALP